MAPSPGTHLDLDAGVLFGGVLLLGLLLAVLAILRQRHGRPPLHDQLALPARHQLREDLPEVQGHALHAMVTSSEECRATVFIYRPSVLIEAPGVEGAVHLKL